METNHTKLSYLLLAILVVGSLLFYVASTAAIFDQFLNLLHSRSLARRQRLRRSLIRRGILRRASSRRKSALGKILVFVLFVCRQRNQPPSCSSEKNCAMNATAVITRS